MSHLRTKGVRRARRLPTVMQRKLATCQATNGRICFASQRSSPGTLRRRTASHFVNQHRRDTLELKHRHCYSQVVQRKRAPFAFRSISLGFCWKSELLIERRSPAVCSEISTYDCRPGAGSCRIGPISFLGQILNIKRVDYLQH